MKTLAKILCFWALTACSGTFQTAFEEPLNATVTRGWNVVGLSVNVPDTLTVTDQNSFAPDADIVWHGDPEGDRRAQVAAIVREGITRGTNDLRGSRAVKMNVQLQEFHALSPVARERAPSAVHNISFVIQVVDAQTGQVLRGPDQIRADLEAYTGFRAIEEALNGQTQKVRITNHLEKVIEGWLGIGPDPRRTFEIVGR